MKIATPDTLPHRLHRTMQYVGTTALLLLCSCEQLIGADFERRHVTSSGCVPRCGEGTRCNPATRQCECDPLLTCDPSACGAILDSRCGQPVECGACPSGQFCGGETPNQCSATPCTPRTCEEMGYTSGVHASCGILVDCTAPANNCNCPAGQVCTASGCCTPFVYPENTCGPLNNGCGQIEALVCQIETELFCGENNTCCIPSNECATEGTTCGLNEKCGNLVDCEGTCPTQEPCNYDQRQAHYYCGDCAPQCPTNAVCGLNADTGCPGQSILCDGTCPTGEVCNESPFRCCRPACPATPSACGANDDGCGGTIQCPGPCPTAQSCRATGPETFACSPQ